LDLAKLPLGKISRTQIMRTYGVLSTALKILGEESSQKRDRHIADITNRFYTMVPHNFGLAQPPLLNGVTMIKVTIEYIIV